MLEVDKIAHLDVERVSNSNQNINTNVSRPNLNLPKVGSTNPRHERKLALRNVSSGACCPYMGA